MIIGIDLRTLRNAEYIQYLNDSVSIVNANDPIALNVVAQTTALETKITALETLFVTEMSNPITAELAALDQKRDKYIVGISSVVNGFINHFDINKQAAATALSNNLSLYGAGIQLQNYQAETATLNSLIGDWENKPELVAALTTLGLTDWKEELKNTNNTFNAKYILRTQEYGAASPENIKSKREEANAVYYELRNFIVAYATINATNPLYTKTVNELNALITQYNQLLTNRASNSSSEPTNPTEPEV